VRSRERRAIATRGLDIIRYQSWEEPNMRLGVDGRKIPESAKRGPVRSLEHGKELGMAGLFFRTVLDMSPTLDPGELKAIRERADDLGMYMETGLGKVNPYASPEAPELRAIGDGDIVEGFRRMIVACAAIDCRELWISTANFKPNYRGRLAYDRFRTDVTWQDQLDATERFLQKLAPIAADYGVHMNLETHEEITSFEVVRLVESVGPQAMGVVYDTANPLQRGEHPLFAARRLAPYVRQTHIKDAFLGYHDGALDFQLRPCGQGVVDFRQILPILAKANPDLNLSIENDDSHVDRPRPIVRRRVDIFDALWLDGHPDLTVEEYGAYMHMVQEYGQKIASGELVPWKVYADRPYGYTETVAFIKESASYLRRICAEVGITLK
jgi:sugar phosphate isomerase/epimerase